jgi:hypothetical protein
LQANLAGSSSITGSIDNNNVNTSSAGFNITTNNTSNFAANITNNVMYVQFLMNGTNVDSSTYSGVISGNTFIGNDGGDPSIQWNAGSAGAVSVTFSDNLWTGAFSGVTLASSGTGVTTFEFLNNTIQNSTGSLFIGNSGTNLRTTISDNAFQGFVQNAVNVTNTAGEMCLNLNNNTSNPYPNAYSITSTGGTLNLVPPTGNVGQIITSGTTSASHCP